ncbi:MAG: putative addiction module antidote protein [Thiopseudomonas sp.]
MVKISELKRFDAAEYLDTEQAITEYLTIVLEENDPAAFMRALNTVARARGMTQIARDAGVNRESLYKSLNGNAAPRFDTIQRVLAALGVKLVAVPSDTAAM